MFGGALGELALGQQPGVLETLDAQKGDLTLTAGNATFALVTAVGAGALTLTGGTATFTLTAAFDGGTLTLTGGIADFRSFRPGASNYPHDRHRRAGRRRPFRRYERKIRRIHDDGTVEEIPFVRPKPPTPPPFRLPPDVLGLSTPQAETAPSIVPAIPPIPGIDAGRIFAALRDIADEQDLEALLMLPIDTAPVPPVLTAAVEAEMIARDDADAMALLALL